MKQKTITKIGAMFVVMIFLFSISSYAAVNTTELAQQATAATETGKEKATGILTGLFGNDKAKLSQDIQDFNKKLVDFKAKMKEKGFDVDKGTSTAVTPTKGSSGGVKTPPSKTPSPEEMIKKLRGAESPSAAKKICQQIQQYKSEEAYKKADAKLKKAYNTICKTYNLKW